MVQGLGGADLPCQETGGGDLQQAGLGLRPEIHDQAHAEAARQQGAPQCLFRLPGFKGNGAPGTAHRGGEGDLAAYPGLRTGALPL